MRNELEDFMNYFAVTIYEIGRIFSAIKDLQNIMVKSIYKLEKN